MIGKVKIRYLFLLAWLAALSTKAQVSSENYILTTERISDTQVLSTTEYYDGLGRPFEKVEQKKTPNGANLIHLQEYELNKIHPKTPDIKKQKNALERQMKRAKEKMDFKGENHSRNAKGH